MYKHFLIPIDQSGLSIINVGDAVKLANSLGAKVTFFHANADYAATVENARSKVQLEEKVRRASFFLGGSALSTPILTPEECHERTISQSRALLAKAGAAATAQTVAYDTLAVDSDQPVEAIIKAAHECKCDLIVMASHGHSGLRTLLTPSVATQVMREAGVPVLITRTESTDKQVEASRVIALIKDEHRSMAAVLNAMKHHIAEARSGDTGFDHALFGRMLQYIHDYPEKRHHPKEELSLHRLMRERGDRGRELLHTLEAQHLTEYELATAVQRAFGECSDGVRGDDPQLNRLDEAACALSEHVWQHLRLEEESMLPLALEVLTRHDWKEIGECFAGNRDPGFGEWSEEEFRDHFRSLLNASSLPQAATVSFGNVV
ncbi:MAG: universal stress protein [Ideonella sp.]